jgi:hypothetical protein
MVAALLLLAAAAAQPSPEAMRLGQEIARSGTLAALLPLMKEQQIKELLGAHPELSSADQAKLRITAERIFESGRNRILDGEARAYAANLSLADLRVAAAYYRTAAARRMQAALPKVIATTMQSVQGLDFKADVRAAYCKETAKLCGK